MGRPTTYTDDHPAKVAEYLLSCEEHGRLPSKTRLALYLDCSKRVLDDWAEKYPDFMRALEIVKYTQRAVLMERGLDSTYNSTIAKLILSSNHGMSDKLAQEHSGSASFMQALSGAVRGNSDK